MNGAVTVGKKKRGWATLYLKDMDENRRKSVNVMQCINNFQEVYQKHYRTFSRRCLPLEDGMDVDCVRITVTNLKPKFQNKFIKFTVPSIFNSINTRSSSSPFFA